MSIQKILVPTDFSNISKMALSAAAKIAAKANAELHLIHAVHVPVIDPYTPAETINTIREEEERSAREELSKLVLSYTEVVPKIHVKMGFAVDEIVLFAEENNIDLIVMGTTGSAGLEEALIGSNASGVVDKAKVLVLCIPDELKTFEAGDIVYASDLEDNDAEVINKMLEFATVFGSNFHVLHVRPNDLPTDGPGAEETFRTIVGTTSYPSISFHEVKNEDVKEAIEQFIQKTPCDILAMAIHHRGFFGKLFHSSLTKKMVNHSHLPVLTYYKK
jgi:nucleotide-binding universal stress UspA family protein